MSAFRLPRLPRNVAIVTKDGLPSLQFQRWWQSVVTTLETQEGIQDQALTDIQTALTNAGIALATATEALDNANAIMPDIAPVTITADYTGTILDGQLPRNIAATRFDGETDVTTESEWSAETVSGDATYTIGAATGVLNLTDIAATSVVEITSEYEGIIRSRKVPITKALEEPPPSSGGTETALDRSISSTSAGSYGSANAGPLTLTCGASGVFELTAPLKFFATVAGTFHAYGKWQVSPAGAGTWADVGTEIQSDVPTENSGANEGAISVNQSATGLTPASDYDVRLLLRNASGSHTLFYAGTASATTE